MKSRFVTSRYNFLVPVEDGVLLYSAKTGAVLRFTGIDAGRLARNLCLGPHAVSKDSFPPETFQQLRQGGFVISKSTNELQIIRRRFKRGRNDTPIVLTLTTTMDCNLGCYYCYEERFSDRLQLQDVDQIVEIARERVSRSGKRGIHIDWYGGEPLMNIDFIEAASKALQAFCKEAGIAYASSVISNGTCWPNDVGAFIERHRILQVQISFDGLRNNHNRRRRFRRNYRPEDGASSFDNAVELVDKLLYHTHVDLRLNVDRENQQDVLPFIDFARARGWFDRPFPAVLQPARLSSYSEHSSFMRYSELSLEEYDEIRAIVRAEMKGEALVEESETPDGFPYPKTSVCAALANDSVVVGADRRYYRCGLQAAEPHRSVGSIPASSRRQLPVIHAGAGQTESDEKWWAQFDPTTLPNCSRCSFLPVCWGGCPKKHLEQDTHAISEQSVFWRHNLPRLVAEGVGATRQTGFVFTEADQFR